MQKMRRRDVREGERDMARMRTKYKEEVAPALMEKFGYKSVMQIPRLEVDQIRRRSNVT